MEEQPKNHPMDMNKWREIINNWNKKNESQRTYCERIGINLNAFTYARIKLQQQNQPKSKIHFASLSVKNTHTDKVAESSHIILENRRDNKLHFPTTLLPEQLIEIIKLLGWNDV